VNPSGCAPFGAVIHVEVPTSGNSFFWEITTPNGNILTSSSTTYVSIFTIPGTYDVTLTINGTSTETVEDYITVFAPPTASFSANDPLGCAPHCTDFTNTSVAGTSPITSYNWDFGDGYTSTDQNPNHCYQDAGNYSPILSITDANGCFSNLSIVSHIQIPINSVNANFSADQLVTCETPAIINFTNSSTGNNDFTSFWNFGDGSSFSSANLSSQTHEYEEEGTYNVCLLVVDEYGCENEECSTITVVEQPLPIATADDYSSCTNQEITFQVTSSAAIETVQWDFNNDGIIDETNTNPTFTFSIAGTYNPSIIVSHENGCVQTIALNNPIVVNNIPSGNITTSSTSSCVVPFSPTITALAAGAGPFTYSWIINENVVGNASTLLFPFEESGSYDVTVEITNNAGCTATITSEDLIHINSPQIGLVHYSTACIGQEFTPTDFIINTPSEVLDYSWDFDGDGIEDSSDSLPTFIYNELGTYSITIEIHTADGCNAIHTSETPVEVINVLTSEFTYNYTETCAAQFIQFCAPENTENTYSWNFGNGNAWSTTSLTDNCVEYTYDDTGYFDIRVRVTNGACLTLDTLPDFIHIATPVALFTMNVSCDDHLTVTVYDESIGATSLEWNFGDGTAHVFNETIVEHTYAAFGNYQIRLTASDGNETCDYTEIHTVRLKEPDASVNFSSNSGCAPFAVTLDENTSNNYWEVEISNGDSFISDWNGGQDVWEITYVHDGETEEYDVPQGEIFWPDFVFTEQGCYDFTVTIYDRYNCPDVEHYEDIVCALSNIDFAQFDFSLLQSCDPVEMNFTPVESNLTLTEWSFGDGASSLEFSPTHTFLPPFNLEEGLSITLHATDDAGCESTVTQHPEVTLPSTPGFVISSETTCLSEEIYFTNNSNGPVESFYWTFGDPLSGDLNTSTEENPMHVYNQNGLYEVCLTVVSPSGCSRTYCDENAVEISTPQVSFTFESAMNNCLYGVEFTSTSGGNNSSFEWNFGDDQIGYGESVFHTYPIGVFDVNLVVTGSNGCVDSLLVSDIFSYGNQIGPYSTVVEEINCAPFHVEFQAFAPTDTYFTYFWDFNDGYGIPSGDVSVSHDYLSAGSYCPQLIMTDPNGCEVFVPCESPIEVADFEITHSIPAEICFGDSVSVSLQNADAYSWNNEEYVEAGATPSEFVIHPTQTVDFIITGTTGDCQSIDTVQVIVHSLPEVVLELPEQVCYGAESFQIIGGFPTGEAGQYSLNGLPVESFDPSQNDDAWYVINYNYVDSNGCANSSLDSIYIRPLPIVTMNEIEPLCENSEAIEIIGGMPEQGVYMMGDSAVTSFDPSIGFGVYSLQYTFTDSLGCTSSVEGEIVVHAVPEIHLSFDSICANLPFELTNNSFVVDDQIGQTEWTFGDANSIFGITPGEVLLTEIGENPFHVKITSSEGCISEQDTTAFVFPVPQTAFSVEDGCAGTSLEFVSTSTTAEGYISNLNWYLSEENIGGHDTLTYSFDDWGSPTLTLISENSFGCVDTLSQQVSVYPLPEVDVFSTDVCLGETSVFTSAVDIAYGSVENYQWIMQDSILVENSGSVSFLFSSSGAFTGSLIAQSDLGCINMDSVSVYVNAGPVVEFAVEQSGYCPDSDVYFFDLSSIDSPGSFLNEWEWYFDGELVSTDPNPIIHLIDPASYDVTLVVSTNTGCSGELAMDNFVTVYPKPNAGFVVENSDLNMANPFVEVINTSSNDVTTWTYDFGDGSIESFENGVHEYSDWMNYSILQTVSNIFGCTDTASYSVTVLPSIIVNIPNAFTPDGNGHNDVFFPVLYGSEVLFFEFDIYDRWGRLMYEAASTEDGWDGTIRETGEMAPCGVYNWKMSIRTVDQPLMKQTMGSVVLIK
jgi:gliding motility-associated-like protein